jgi:hypothetical protein
MPGKELAHGSCRVPIVHQVTADEEINRRQVKGLVRPAQTGKMRDLIPLQLLRTEVEGTGGAVIDIERRAKATDDECLKADPRSEHQH